MSDGTTSTDATLGFSLAAANDAPALTGTAATLDAGTEDTAYVVSASDLLAGWTDADGNSLSITDLVADHGSVVANGDGTYSIMPTANYNGPVSLSYKVSDGTSSASASLGFSLAAVNDAPALTGTAATLAAGSQNIAYSITTAQLLQGWTDFEGQNVAVTNLTADHGTVTAGNGDTYTLTPEANYFGVVRLSYSVSDGAASTISILAANLAGPSDGADNLVGTSGNDTITLLRGNDVYDGLGGEDIIVGNSGNDTLDGGPENDFLAGEDDDDTAIVSTGNDVFEGGTGIDTIDFSSAVGAISTQLQIDNYFVLAHSNADSIRFNSVEKIIASSGDDTIDLSGVRNGIFIEGRAGHDHISGGINSDRLDGGTENDFLVGGVGDDTIIGGAGEDTSGYSGLRSDYTFTENPDGSVNVTDGAFTDTLTDIEFVQFGSGTSANTVAMAILLDRIAPVLSNETNIGGDHDTISFTVNTDEAGTLRVYKESMLVTTLAVIAGANAVSIDGLTPNTAYTFTYTVTDAAENISNIETISRTTAKSPTATGGDDLINGTDGRDLIDGLAGNDIINGLDGEDALSGGDHDDTLSGGRGDDQLDGGGGADTAVFGGAPSSYVLALAGGGALTIQDLRQGSPDGTDTLSSVEFIKWGGSTPTRLILGGIGNDTLSGVEGSDTAYGFEGNDTYVAGAKGSDFFYGGDDFDTADFSTATVAVVGTVATTGFQVFNMSDGDENFDALAVRNDVEKVVLTNFGDLLLFSPLRTTGVEVHAGDGADTIRGGPGNDKLYGGAGVDVLRDSGGADWLYGGSGSDAFYFSSTNNTPPGDPDWVKDFDHQTDKIDLRQLDADPIRENFQGFTFASSTSAMDTSVGNVVVTDISFGEFLIEIYLAGDSVIDASIRITSTGGLNASDFLLSF